MPYHVAWNHVHKYMVSQFKYVAIEKAGGMPDVWPWKKESASESLTVDSPTANE